MNYLDQRELKGISTDTIIDEGRCGRERPDRVFDLGDKIIILEVDERQHKAYECDKTRMFNIGQAFGGLPVYFIRWNPDNYYPGEEKLTIEPVKKRQQMVGDLIQYILDGAKLEHKAMVYSLYMYYDGWIGLGKEKWEKDMLYEVES